MEQKLFSLKNAYSSPRKAGLILPVIQGKKTSKALQDLEFSDKKASLQWKKLIKSGTSYFEDKGFPEPTIVEAYVGPGLAGKKRMIKSRGRSTLLKKRRSNLYIKLQSESKAD